MRTRTIVMAGGALMAGALALGVLAAASAQTPPGPRSWGVEQGRMMGMAGAMGPGHGGGIMGVCRQDMPGPAAPLASRTDAEQAFQRYLAATGNADLVLDEVMEFEHHFYAIVKEKSTGIGAFELLASRQTGAVSPEVGPNMMWNIKYGHMGQNSWMAQMMGYQPPSGPATVSPEQARQLAQQWLDRYQPGSGTEMPDAFYGYYTVHITRDGKVTGMLSVNASTGQVWYHAWHGAFIAS